MSQNFCTLSITNERSIYAVTFLEYSGIMYVNNVHIFFHNTEKLSVLC